MTLFGWEDLPIMRQNYVVYLAISLLELLLKCITYWMIAPNTLTAKACGKKYPGIP